MKKLISLSVALLSITGMAYAQTATIKVTTTDEQQKSKFTTKLLMEGQDTVRQNIMTNPIFEDPNVDYQIFNFHVECLATANDLKNGQEGALPKFAEVTSLVLQGKNLYKNRYMKVEAWVENTELAAIRNINKTTEQEPLPGDTFKVAGKTLMTLPEVNAVGNIVNLPFDIAPFYYTGKGVYVTLNMDTPKNLHFYFNTTLAETKVPVVYRNNRLPFYAGMDNSGVPDNWKDAANKLIESLGITYHRLPAYELEYYTHDIIVTCAGDNGVGIEGVQVKIENKENPNEVYTLTTDEAGKAIVEALDWHNTYVITLTGKGFDGLTAEQAFDNNKNDIKVDASLQAPTAVEDVNAAKTVSSVRYYNMQGMESAEPFSGVNIVVTNYADGSKATSKVVK